MSDLEKILSGLDRCSKNECSGCPDGDDCHIGMICGDAAAVIRMLFDENKRLRELVDNPETEITAKEYQLAAMKTARVPSDSWLDNAALGLCGEAGDVADLVRKCRFLGVPLDRQHVIEELGDVAWYVALTATAIGVDLGEVLLANLDKLRRKFSPDLERSRTITQEDNYYA